MGDIQNRSNYCGIKLMNDAMKLMERMFKNRTMCDTKILGSQFGFMPECR